MNHGIAHTRVGHEFEVGRIGHARVALRLVLKVIPPAHQKIQRFMGEQVMFSVNCRFSRALRSQRVDTAEGLVTAGSA